MASKKVKSLLIWLFVVIVLLVWNTWLSVSISRLDVMDLRSELNRVEIVKTDLNSMISTQKESDAILLEQFATFQNKITELESQMSRLQPSSSSNAASGSSWILIILVLVIALAVFFYFSREQTKKIKELDEKLKNSLSQMKEQAGKIKELDEKFKKSPSQKEEQVESLPPSHNALGDNPSENNKVLSNTDKQDDEETGKIFADRYLSGKWRGAFSLISETPEGSFYKIVNENEKDGTAEFEYCGTIGNARNQFNAIFDHVCDTEGDVQNADSFKTERGTLKFEDDKWIVQNKAKIKFE